MTKALLAAGVRAASVGLVTIALVAGCSSTTSGSPSNGKGGGAGSGGGGGFGGGSSGSSVPTGGGGSAGSGNFCHDWQTISSDLGNVSSGDIGSRLVAKFDALAAEAPAAVKSDVTAIDGYVHGILTGHADPTKGEQFATSFEHVGVWIAQNC